MIEVLEEAKVHQPLIVYLNSEKKRRGGGEKGRFRQCEADKNGFLFPFS